MLSPLTEETKDVGGDETAVFSLGAGPLIVTTDTGLAIGFGSQSSRRSVTLWLERGRIDGLDERGWEKDRSDLHVLDAADSRYVDPDTRSLTRRRIESVHVLKRDMPDVHLPREVGVVLRFEGGGELIPAHNLHRGSDNFGVIRRDQILPSILPELRELTLDELDDVTPNLPSRHIPLLRRLRGERLVAMTRHCNFPIEELEQQPGGPLDVFSGAPGPLALKAESGLVIGVSSHSSLRAIELWLEPDWTVHGLNEYPDPVDSTDSRHVHPEIRVLVGRRIEDIRLLERAILGSEPSSLETGIVLRFEGGKELILAFGIHEDAEHLGVIRRDQILPPIVPQLRELTLDELEALKTKREAD
jgi:hypothetical protein